ncbi:hypothetical protein RQP46_011457 [Phenoliferia psychrophenolica]
MLIEPAFDFRTLRSPGLVMYYSKAPYHLCEPKLPIPASQPTNAIYGPFERRPAGEFLKFTLHRTPIEQLAARWRTGDIREVVRRMGSPTAGMAREAQRALLLERSAADAKALVDFQVAVRKEFNVILVVRAGAHLQLEEGAELFAHLAFAAIRTLLAEVDQYSRGWASLERTLASEPVTVGSLLAGVASTFAFYFGSSSSPNSGAPGSLPTNPRQSHRKASATCAAPSLSPELATPSFRSGRHSATALLAVGVQRLV